MKTNTNPSKLTNGQKIIIILAIFVATFLLSQFIGLGILNFFDVGINIADVNENDSFAIFGIKLSQAISSLLLFVLSPLVIAKALGYNPLDYLKLKISPKFRYYILILFFMIFSYPLLMFISEWNVQIAFPESIKFLEEMLRSFEDINGNVTNLILSGTSTLDLIINIIVIALIPAIGEELVFRGLVQKYFIKFLKNPHISIFITAFIFSAIHLSFFGFFPRFILGIFLGYLAWNFNSLYPSIFAHFLNNAFVTCMAFYFASIGQKENIENMNFYPENKFIFIATIIFSLALGFLLFAKFRKKEKTTN